MSTAESQRRGARPPPKTGRPTDRPDPLIRAQARPHRRAGLAPGRAAQGPRRGALRRRVRRCEGMVYAALRYSTIARGRITTLDTSAAEAAAGVVLVMTHRNAPRDAAAAAVPDRAEGGRRQRPARHAGRQHPLERRADRGRPGRNPGAGRPRRVADRGRLRILDAADLRGGHGDTRARPTASSASRSRCSIGDAEAALAGRAALGRSHLPHAAPQPQRDRAARGHARRGTATT